ncbi:Trihelix transcription factor GT-2 [Bienertia sinuspersici]
MEVTGGGFPEELSPFPEVEAQVEDEAEADLSYTVGYLYPEPTSAVMQKQKQKQKLRPIRSNARSRCDCDCDCDGDAANQSESELGFDELVKLKSQMDAHFISTFNQHSTSLSQLCASFSSGSESSRGKSGRKRKKMECYVEELVGQVMKKQEQMQQQLMEVIQKKEKERVDREEAWRQHQMLRLNNDHHIRSQEAARSLTLIHFIRNALDLPPFQLPHFSPS